MYQLHYVSILEKGSPSHAVKETNLNIYRIFCGLYLIVDSRLSGNSERGMIEQMIDLNKI